MLRAVGGSWEPASVTGTVRRVGWGEAKGYPGIVLDDRGGEVEGFLFSSENLAAHWAALDEFEGEAYERVRTPVKLARGGAVEAFIYEMRKPDGA